MGLFFRSEPPGLVFSVPYPWGSFAPSAFSSTSSQLRFPPKLSHEKDGGLLSVTSEKPNNPLLIGMPYKQFDAVSSDRLCVSTA